LRPSWRGSRPVRPASPSGRRFSDRRSRQLIDEQLVQGEASALGIDVSDDEVQRLVEQLARENHMDMTQFRQALAQQGLSMDSVRDSLKRQQLMMRLLQYKVKPRRVSDEEVQAAYANMTKTSEYEVRARDIFISAPTAPPRSR